MLPSIRWPTTTLLFTWLPLFIQPSSSEGPVYGPQDVEPYVMGDYGRSPNQTFHSTDFVAPKVLHRIWGPECEAGDDMLFIAPHGSMIDDPGPVILDSKGHMVWHDTTFRQNMSYGFDVQNYKGRQYMTFWNGNSLYHGHGTGYYYMFDDTYRMVKNISAPNGMMGDVHEFSITRDDTLVFTTYVLTAADLRPAGGPEDGWFYDSVFGEMDIETGEMLFEWRSADYITPGDTSRPLFLNKNSGTLKQPWDLYHINSVEKDLLGNFLVSLRYTHTIYYINGKTGEPIWYLGGQNNSFTDLSNGTATDFRWQHHARWVDDRHEELTIFDNHAIGTTDHWRQPAARGLKVRINVVDMTVAVSLEVTHPLGIISITQGSLHNLPNGNMLVGYGSAPAVSEFTAQGELVCDMLFGAIFPDNFHFLLTPGVITYRAFKRQWVGRPYYDPNVTFQEDILFVSWNGATEVKTWRVQGSNIEMPSEYQWTTVGEVEKEGFESNITVPLTYQAFRLTALSRRGNIEGVWTITPGGVVQRVRGHEQDARRPNHFVLFVLGIAVALAAMMHRQLRKWWAQWRPVASRIATKSLRSAGVIGRRYGLHMASKEDVERHGLLAET